GKWLISRWVASIGGPIGNLSGSKVPPIGQGTRTDGLAWYSALQHLSANSPVEGPGWQGLWRISDKDLVL
ncbi:MAG TPA: hypothetical protein PKV71_21395, partial [Calditrichia bacterium]|nr:hypothetical protein [Calditrichia bacterium]